MNYNMKRWTVFFLLVLSVLVASCSLRPCIERTATVDITILHVNDTHGHILPHINKSIDPNVPVGDAACLAAMIRHERKKNPDGTILLSGGDMSQGTPISNIFYGKPVIEIMNDLHFDAMVIGNHEFDWTVNVLEQMIEWADFPTLSGNVVTKKGTYINGASPYIILDRRQRFPYRH